MGKEIENLESVHCDYDESVGRMKRSTMQCN